MPVRPLSDRVLILPASSPSVSAGGVYLPENVREQPIKGTVVAAGPGVRLANGSRGPLRVKVGDTVVYGKYAGTEVRVEGRKHIILRETELLGTLG